MKSRLKGLTAGLTGALLISTLVPANAQTTPPPVLILPVNGAQFLPGALFDVRVEVHAKAMPKDFAVTLNGEDVLANAELSSWAADKSLIKIDAQAATWRELKLDEPGEYVFEVTAGGKTHTATWTVREVGIGGGAKNVILFVPDGGSVAVNTAARLVSRGMTQGTYKDRLSFESWEELGLVSTSGLDSIMTDSANSASAYNTGHKSAVNATGVYPDTSADPFDDPQVETLAQMLKRTRDMAVGIVTTSEYVDATPAAVWAHSRQRNSTTRADYALQVIGQGVISDRLESLAPEVILGGGASYLLPQATEGSGRKDDVDVAAAYEDAGYTIVENATDLSAAIEETATTKLAGFFHPSNMDVWLDRNVYTETVGTYIDQPGLAQMTRAALEVLSRNENGFYLMVEAASVDKQLHPMDFERGIADMIELDRTVAATTEWLKEKGMLEETLMVIVPDHAHSFEVFGTVDVQKFNAAKDDNEKRNAIGVYQAAGFPDYKDEDGDFFPDTWVISRTLAWGKVENPPFTEDFQVSPVPRAPSIPNADGVIVDNPEDDPNGLPLGGNLPTAANSSVHTLQDVPVWAQGPGAEKFGGMLDNTEIFFAMADALDLDPRGQ